MRTPNSRGDRRFALSALAIGQNRCMSTRPPLPLALSLALFIHGASASPSSAGDPIERAVRAFVEAETRGLGPGVSVDIPPRDARTRIGQCAAPEVFLPTGTRLWGRTRVGVRCPGPSKWLIYQPVHVKVSGRFFVSSRQIKIGEMLTDADFESRTGELTALPDDVANDPDQLRGRKARQPVAPGQPLRKEHLQRELLFRQGDKVRIVVRGAGFSVSSEGTALANGYEGEPARVRNAAGKTVEGRARAAGTVELTP